MRKLFTILFILTSLFASAQTPLGTIVGGGTTIEVPVNQSGSTKFRAIIWLPKNYATDVNKKYPLHIFLHGAGEGNADQNVNRLLAQSIPKMLNRGDFPNYSPYGIDSLTQDTVRWIIVAPMNHVAWGLHGSHVRWILPNLIANYRVDTNQIHIAGFSAGGEGAMSVAGLANADTVFGRQFASIMPMASTGNSTSAEAIRVYKGVKKYNIAFWQIGGTGDSWLSSMQRYRDSIAARSPTAPNVLVTIQDGNHGSLTVEPPYALNATMFYGKNYWTRMLDYNQAYENSLPTASAGNNANITLPLDSVTLYGSATPGTGNTITAYAWTKISGNGTQTIHSPTSATTKITGLQTGYYTFRLTVTNSAAATAYGEVLITVNDNPPTITSNSGTITLPTSTTNLTSTPVTNYTIDTIRWTKFDSPNQTNFKVVAIGSSTFAGNTLPNNAANGIISRLRNYYRTTSITDTIINQAASGTSIFDAQAQITTALNTNPHVLLLSYPSNNYDNNTYTVSQICQEYQKIADSCTNRGVQYYFLGTQPRDDFNSTYKAKLKTINDSLRLRFADRFIDVLTPMLDTLTNNRKYEYAYSGDLIHLNELGHERLFQLVRAKNIFKNLISSSTTISSPTSQNTAITGLSQGTHSFQISIIDRRGFAASSVSVVTVIADGNNQLPTANAGTDQSITPPTSQVTLTGSATNPDGTIASYAWTKITGTGGTITSPSSATTTVTGLTPGTYVFRLTATDDDGGQDTDDVTITVNAQPACSGQRYILTPNQNVGGIVNGYYGSGGYSPGDTIVVKGSWSYIAFLNLEGLPNCPIVIINDSAAVTMTAGFGFQDCKYIKLTGTGTGDTYGFQLLGNEALDGVGVGISRKSKNIEISNLFINRMAYGFWIKNEASDMVAGCDTSIAHPYWVLDSISVHHCYIRNMSSQGFYMGSTDPDNIDRPIDCGSGNIYPKPTRLSNITIYNNIVDSTGRPGIQLSAAYTGTNEIYNNTISNTGRQNDDAQGTGITLGTYSRARIYNNTIRKTLTWGIVSIGGSGHLIIENNNIDSSGYTTNGYTRNWPANIQIDTRSTTPVDSTTFSIRNNVLGVHGSATNDHISIADQQNTIGSNNIICGNTVKGTTQWATVTVAGGVSYSTNTCITRPYRKKGLVFRIGRKIRVRDGF